jgi:hypothetical protein
VEAALVVRGEMAVQVQVRRVVRKIQVQALHQIFQAHRWNMVVAEMEIMVVRQELPELVQEVRQELQILLHLQIGVAADHKCRTLDTKAVKVAQVL